MYPKVKGRKMTKSMRDIWYALHVTERTFTPRRSRSVMGGNHQLDAAKHLEKAGLIRECFMHDSEHFREWVLSKSAALALAEAR